MSWSPYQAASDARAWAQASRLAAVDRAARLSWWHRRLLWLALRTQPVVTVLRLEMEAEVLLKFADAQEDLIEAEGTPTPREAHWRENE